MSHAKPPKRQPADLQPQTDPGTPAPAPSGSPRTEPSDAAVEQLRQELAQANDRYLRTLAEVENTKKRLRRERDEFAKYASETIVRGLLPIADSLRQALTAVAQHADHDAVAKGVRLIAEQFDGFLRQEGVQRIATAGEAFDPHRHEAIAQVEATDGQADNTVVEEVQVGYTLHGKVIRPAMVKVAIIKTADSVERTADSQDQSKDPNTQQLKEDS